MYGGRQKITMQMQIDRAEQDLKNQKPTQIPIVLTNNQHSFKDIRWTFVARYYGGDPRLMLVNQIGEQRDKK
jgi:hypothetical protein